MCKLVFAAALGCLVFSSMLAGSAAGQCGQMRFPTAGETPVYWWPADGTALDIVTGDEATLENGASYEPGVIGLAFSFNFNGEFQSVTIPHSDSWDFGLCDFSISVWAKAKKGIGGVPLVSHTQGGGFRTSGFSGCWQGGGWTDF